LLAEFAESFAPMSGLVAEKVGYGLGTRDNETRPNVLRAVLGTTTQTSSTLDWESDQIAVLETNLDDLSPEILGGLVEQSLMAGALDVFHTPVQMKKNRPGVLLTILCAVADTDRFTELMLRETTAFGVRRSVMDRRKLKREQIEVETPFGRIKVKVGLLNGARVQAAPEFESCRKAAAEMKATIRAVYQAALNAVE
jgi:uncharacterized protein (DUF111 family)